MEELRTHKNLKSYSAEEFHKLLDAQWKTINKIS
jgi:hypothetical protein